MKVYALDTNKNVIEYEVIMTFKGSQNFVIYTDNTIENGKLAIYSAVYDPETGKILRDIKTQEEAKEIAKAFKESIIEVE